MTKVRSLGGHICRGTPSRPTAVAERSLATALRANLQRCLHQSEGATKENLAALAGAGPCTFQTWISGRVRPTLDHLCRLAYQLKLPLIQLFQGVPAEWRGPDHLGRDIGRLRGRLQSQPRIEPGELRRILTAALTETPAPSVAEVARRLKFRRTQTLVSREPELCKQIALRRRQSGFRPSATRQLYPRSERAASKPFCADTSRRKARHQ